MYKELPVSLCALGFVLFYCFSPAGLTVDDIDVFEINEAFASQVRLRENNMKIPSNCSVTFLQTSSGCLC